MRRHPNDGWIFADPYPMWASTTRALRGLVRAMCPGLAGFELSDGEERVELHVRRMLRYMPPIVASGFVLAVHLLDWAPIWRLAAVSRIQRLPQLRAERVLMDMIESRSALVRTLLLAVRGITLSTFYDQDETHRAMGFHPLPFLSDRVELRRRLLMAPRASDGAAPIGERAHP